MRYLFSLIVVLFFFSCKDEFKIEGTWKLFETYPVGNNIITDYNYFLFRKDSTGMYFEDLRNIKLPDTNITNFILESKYDSIYIDSIEYGFPILVKDRFSYIYKDAILYYYYRDFKAKEPIQYKVKNQNNLLYFECINCTYSDYFVLKKAEEL